MIDRVRADRGERIARNLADLVPGHAQFVADRGAVDPVARTEIAHGRPQLVFTGEAAQPPINVLEQLVFRFGRMAVVAAILAVHPKREAADARDRSLKGQPPEFAGAIREAGRDIDRERRIVFPQDRQRIARVVAIAIVEGKAYEAAAEILLLEPALHFVERDD